ncbi:hypothetical protein D3C78_308560 [compost metagenome]
MDISQESVMGSLKTGMDKVLGGTLKHVREAGHLAGLCKKLKDGASEKTLTDESIAKVVRPDVGLVSDPIAYTKEMLDFVQYFHNHEIFRQHDGWVKGVNKAFASIDFSSGDAMYDSMLKMAKDMPQGRLDKMPSELRSMKAPGEAETWYRAEQPLDKEDDYFCLPEFKRFQKPGTSLNLGPNYGVRRKAYSGDGQLPVLSVDQCKRIFEMYAEAEKAFWVGNKVQGLGWKEVAWPTKKFDALVWKGSDHKKSLGLKGSYILLSAWIRGELAMATTPIWNTRQHQAFFEAMFRWAKRSFELHNRNASLESNPTYQW